jgi:hypothetical protein
VCGGIIFLYFTDNLVQLDDMLKKIEFWSDRVVTPTLKESDRKMSVPNRKLKSTDFTKTIQYTNDVKIVREYLILTDGSCRPHTEEHYNEWDVCFYLKYWHFDGSVSMVRMYNPNAKTWRETEEILLYSYDKAEECTIEDVYKFDKLKGRCFQYVNGVEKLSWEPAIW